MSDLIIKVLRFKKSLDYKYDTSKNDYSNNIKNNSLDKLQVFKKMYDQNIDLVHSKLINSLNVIESSIFEKKRSKNTIICRMKLKSFENKRKMIKNSIDKLQELMILDKLIEIEHVQTVSNHPEMKFSDTVGEGDFKVRCFVEPRNFHGEIHGIINAKDLEGQNIDRYSTQIDNGYQKGRWLIHDRWSWEKNRDLNNGYSGGCFVMSSIQLAKLNETLKNNGVNSGDIIEGKLEMIVKENELNTNSGE